MIVIIEEVDRLKLFEKFDQTSVYNYCRNNLKLTRAISYSYQAVSRKVRKVPELLTAMQEGLSLSFANKLVSQITPENQAMWIEKALTLEQADLGFELRAADPRRRRATKKEAINKTHSRMSIDIANTTLTLLIRAQELLDVPEEEVLHKALETLLEKIDPVRKADRAMKKRNSAAAESNFPETFVSAKLANHVPFNAKTYHEVNSRDRGQCQKILADRKKCCSSRWVEIHHVIDRALGGSNHPSNLVTLCSAHHRIHHRHQQRLGVWSPIVAYSA